MLRYFALLWKWAKLFALRFHILNYFWFLVALLNILWRNNVSILASKEKQKAKSLWCLWRWLNWRQVLKCNVTDGLRNMYARSENFLELQLLSFSFSIKAIKKTLENNIKVNVYGRYMDMSFVLQHWCNAGVVVVSKMLMQEHIYMWYSF